MKKFIALFLVFSLTTLSANLYAQKRQGANLIVIKKDGQTTVKMELIAVKKNSLLFLDIKGKDISVDIGDINIIYIVERSTVSSSRARRGLLMGGCLGALYGFVSSPTTLPPVWYEQTTGQKVIVCGLLFAVAGAVTGAIVGRKEYKIKTIQIEGMTDSEIQKALDYLRKKARIRDYK